MNFTYGGTPQTLYPPMDRPPRDVVGPPPIELVRIGRPDAGSFCLGKINEVEVFLCTEISERLAKKRTRTAAVCDTVAGAATAASAAAGVGGIGLLSTVVAAPVVIGLEAGSLALTGVGIALQAFSSIARRKADKHDRIAVLARAKLDSVTDIVSKTLADGRVDDVEFGLVVAELDRYRVLKDEIRHSALPALPNGGIDLAATETALREELAAELRDKIAASTATRRLAIGATTLLNAARAP